MRLAATAHREPLRNRKSVATEDNPGARILEWNAGEEHLLTVSTTTEHLAQPLGHTLGKRFGGSIDCDFFATEPAGSM